MIDRSLVPAHLCLAGSQRCNAEATESNPEIFPRHKRAQILPIEIPARRQRARMPAEAISARRGSAEAPFADL